MGQRHGCDGQDSASAATSRWGSDRRRRGGAVYDDFVRRHGDALLSFAERLVSGASGVDAGDALQDALIRLWGEWQAKPELDERERRRHAWRLVRSACLDAIKKWLGRGSARGRVRTADIERAIDAVDTLAEGGHGDRELLAIGRAINRAAIADPYEGKREQLILGPALAAAFAARRPEAAQVWLKTAAGASQADVARDLEVSGRCRQQLGA
jgi:DNA-directed RNA polymerase specialized sigma24 family protein